MENRRYRINRLPRNSRLILRKLFPNAIMKLLQAMREDRKTDKEEMLARMDANMRSYQETTEANRKADQANADARHEEILGLREEIRTNKVVTDTKLEELA